MPAFLIAACVLATTVGATPNWTPQAGERICYIGNTMADRMQHDGWLETYLHAMFPENKLVFRNLGFPGDEVALRPRSDNFGDPDQWLTKCQADSVFCFFGYNEALKGEANLPAFRKDLAKLIREMKSKKYNGNSPPQIVIFGPLAHEDLDSPHLPSGATNNVALQKVSDAMEEIAAAEQVPFVELFKASQDKYAAAKRPLTMNGVHLLDEGNRQIARAILSQLVPDRSVADDANVKELRAAVLEKNYYWFSRYRVVDGYNVYGGRSKLEWFGQSNADVMRREMEVFDVMTANRDKKIWAVAVGKDYEVKDDNLPSLEVVETNKPGPLPDGGYNYLGADEAIGKMTIHEGLTVNTFASEEQFPRLVNPVQMAVDTDSRLWVAVWPSYPHWNPTEKRTDALLILPDEDQDGRADECIVFADELNSVTGFEFWGGGVVVAAPPELWYLKDTDGDNRADVKLRILQGISSADTHHSANAMLVGPDGWLYWSRGIFNVANFETPTKTYRSKLSGVHRFNPRTFEVEFHFPVGPNPHGHVFDQWGYEFANDGTTGTGSYVNIGKGIGNKQWYKKRVRPVAATGLLSSPNFDDRIQGNFLICNVIGFLGVLQHEIKYEGADLKAVEIDPILYSQDSNFRPSDLEIGGDGALYVADWHNSLIGHMQHNMRDPNRDHDHGRIYRVTQEGRPLKTPAKMTGQSVSEVCEHFYAPDNSTRYRARLELTGRDRDDVLDSVGRFAEQLDVKNSSPSQNQAQALLECLWVFAERRVPRLDLVARLLRAEEPRVRSAAVRALGYWPEQTKGDTALLIKAANDASPLVLAEVLKVAALTSSDQAAALIFKIAGETDDAELQRLAEYAHRSLDLDIWIEERLAARKKIELAGGDEYVLRVGTPKQLLMFSPSEETLSRVLMHKDASGSQIQQAIDGLTALGSATATRVLLEQIQAMPAENVAAIERLEAALLGQERDSLQKELPLVKRLALKQGRGFKRDAGFHAWVTATGPGEVFQSLSGSIKEMAGLLEAIPKMKPEIRASALPELERLVTTGGAIEESAVKQPGVQVAYYDAVPANVANATLAKLVATESYTTDYFRLQLPKGARTEKYALQLSSEIEVPEDGAYTFYCRSDDGSRLYINGEELINNDGSHGPVEKQGTVKLRKGAQSIRVNYCNGQGGYDLRVSWSSQKFKKRPISGDVLSVPQRLSIGVMALQAIDSIPGFEEEKSRIFLSFLDDASMRDAAIAGLSALPMDMVDAGEANGMVKSVLGYLSELPPADRVRGTGRQAIDWLERGIAAGNLSDPTLIQETKKLVVQQLELGVVKHRMMFDRNRLVVKAGSMVEVQFRNTDDMPHNFVIGTPGSLEKIGVLAEEMATDPNSLAQHYVPNVDEVLASSRLLQTGENQPVLFAAPSEPGYYPVVCTYPGHWRRMFTALIVVPNLEAYDSRSDEYLAALSLEPKDELLAMQQRATHAWTVDELNPLLERQSDGMVFGEGKRLFKMASCSSCHKMGDEGVAIGPNLAELAADRKPIDILKSIVQPSDEIADDYRTHVLFLDSGETVSGIITEEKGDTIRVVVDPLASCEPRVINKREIEERSESPVSTMPQGLLDQLTESEIEQLLQYVLARGNANAAVYQTQ